MTELAPVEPCGESPQEHNAEVGLQVVDNSDGRVLCGNTFLEKASTTLFTECRSHRAVFGLLSIDVLAMKIKEGWVHLEILG